MDKIDALFAEKTEELNVRVIAYQFDEEKNLHVLCQRDSDRSYISWSSYYTGEKNSSFENFYNGKYDMDLGQGIRELKKRSGKEVDVNYPMVKELTSLGNDRNRNFSELANEEHDEKTWEIMTSFYNDCLKFWRKEQEKYGNVSNEEVQKLALRDVSVITTNPYSPNGEKLDEKTQEKWIKNKKKQLVNTKNAKLFKNLER
ncbi:hypothetical protein [Siminovitchia fortis]|uniref:hypothetical protein n=1 Tax=Siminovitchia fortis TaxID=254758 RepID=UPI0011A715C9|nr:hypothetical protein [Siminovitchia fortis]